MDIEQCIHGVEFYNPCPACLDPENPPEQLEVESKLITPTGPIEGVVLVKLRRLAHAPERLHLLTRATPGSAGLDLMSAVNITIPGQGHAAVATGLELEIEPGYEGQVRPRSGLALQGIDVLNAPGTIDSDYRKEVMVLLYNRNQAPFAIRKEDRVAQLIISKVEPVLVQEVEELSPSNRGGFGSTGR